MNIDISQFGKGAIRTSEAVKANQFKLAAFAAPVIDWNKPNRSRYFNITNQKMSSSCTAQAARYYGTNLLKNKNGKVEQYSARHIYSQSYIPPDGGAYIWKAMSIPLNQGYMSEVSVPDEDSSEATMRDGSLNGQGVKEALPMKYAQLTNDKDIDHLAAIIDQFGGFQGGFNGHNNMFLPDGFMLIPPNVDWAHSVFFYDYDFYRGEKCLIYPNSWGEEWGDKGYGRLPESFVKSGLFFDPYTYASIEDIDPTSMNNRFVQVAGQKDVWLVRDGKRSLVYNLLAFNLVSGDFTKIEMISQDQLNAIPDTGKVLAGLDQE